MCFCFCNGIRSIWIKKKKKNFSGTKKKHLKTQIKKHITKHIHKHIQKHIKEYRNIRKHINIKKTNNHIKKNRKDHTKKFEICRSTKI